MARSITKQGWVFQALRDITGMSLPRDAQAWLKWYRSQRKSFE